MISHSARATHRISDTDISIQAAHTAATHGLGGRSSNLDVTVMMRPRRTWRSWWRMCATDVADRATLEATVADSPGAWGGFDVAQFQEATARLKVPLPEIHHTPGLRGWLSSPQRDPDRYKVRYRMKLVYHGSSLDVSGELEVTASHPEDDRPDRGDGF